MRFFRYVVDIVFPAVTAYLAASDNAFNFLAQKNIISASLHIEVFQDICLLLNILFTTVVLGGRIVVCEYKQQANEKRIAGLYNMIKQFVQSNFEKISKNGNFNFEMRIFVKEKNLTHFLPKWIHKNRDIFFSIRNIYPFAHNDITENLRFRACPEPQGLVGKCYADKSIYYDESLTETNGSYAMGLPEVRFHDVRHTYATLAMQNHVDPKTLSTALGHATVAFTMDVYAHTSDEMQQDMASKMENFISSM